jgi:2-keto-4-pentenoate hydratase
MDATRVARDLVGARRSAVGLATYPGPMPETLEVAYAIQDQAIAEWPDTVAGWKAGLIAPARRTPGGDERLVGPIWSSTVQTADAEGTEIAMPVYADGFAAVEAEFVIRLDAPVAAGSWTAASVAGLPYAILAGIEIASSPFGEINDHGPAVTASDFGNNAGLIVGAPIRPGTDLETLTVRTELDGRTIGNATGAAIPGGVLTSLAQTLTILGRRGRSVPAGALFATGAVTGVHPAEVGQTAEISFGDLPAMRCRLTSAEPV